MLKKYLFSTAILGLAFLINTTTINAEETSVSNTTTTTTTTTAPNLGSKADIKARRMEELRLRTEKKKADIASKKVERSERLETEKTARSLKIEELKSKQEQFKQNRETLKATFDEMKLQKLENIKQRGLLVSARFNAISEAMYKMLERVTKIVAEKKTAGFDVSSAEDSLTAIELKLANIQSQQESIQTLIDGLESLTPEEIPSSLTEMKNISTSLKSQYEAVRSDMKQLVQTLK